MADYGARYADKRLLAVDRELRRTYATAQKELREKLADFNRKFEVKCRIKKQQLAKGEISKQEYQSWLTGQVFQRNQWESNIRQVNAVMADTNKQAASIIRDNKYDVFAENYNYNAFKAESHTGISFNLYNADAVARLIRDDPQILPEWKIDEKKDYDWNYKKVNNIVKQGIIQGESIDQITKRLCRDLTAMNENKMRNFARTAITGAQNAGRQKQMSDATAMGLKTHKQWLATLDKRTRDAHRRLDGQEVPENKPFKIDGEEIEYPGDPTAPAYLVYNCRCTVVTIFPDYEDRNYNWRDQETIDGKNYQDWKEEKKALPSHGNLNNPNRRRVRRDYSEFDEKGIPHKAKIDGVVENIEYGELFDPTAVQITHDTLEKLNKEYPLDIEMEFVGDIRLYRGYDLTMDMFDLKDFEGVNFDAHYVMKSGNRKPSIEVANENLNYGKMRDEFEMRHLLRLKYGENVTESTAFGVVSDTLEGTLYHEYAHALQDMYGLFGGNRDKRAIEFSSWLYEYHAENKEKARTMSNYAAKHPFEMLSESFVQIQDVEHKDTIAYKTAKYVWGEFEDFMYHKGRWQ